MSPGVEQLKRLIREVHRRSLWQVLALYVGASWVVFEVVQTVTEGLGLPSWFPAFAALLLLIGLPIVLATAFVQEGTSPARRDDPTLMPTARPEFDAGSEGGGAARKWLTWRNAITGGVLALALWGLVAAGWLVLTDQSVATDRGTEWVSRQLLEIDRLRDRGEYAAAFDLAREVEPLVADSVAPDLWAGISWSVDIETDPPGARVYRQPVDAPEGEWELLGTAPLTDVRFAEDQGYRLRFELEGHRPVELLHSAIRGSLIRGYGSGPMIPVQLDPVDELPEEMVRVPGFTADLVDYADYFIDRYEVTNREYERFVTVGGYERPEYWVEPFVREGVEIPWREAVGEFVDRTGRPGPSTWRVGTYPDGQGDYPVSGVSWYEAAAFARFVERELPTSRHWMTALESGHIGQITKVLFPRSNLGGDGPRPVGANRAMNALGIYDLVGNVREWVWNETGEGRGTRGAAWTDAPYHATEILPKSPWNRDPTHGFRLMRTFDDEEKLARLREPVELPGRRDYREEEPASDAEFEIYRRLYAYDPVPLNAELEEADTLEHWIRETVAFDLPYGERGGAFLYLPRGTDPPFEGILYWGGQHVVLHSVWVPAFGFLMKSGRAVAVPFFKGAPQRIDSTYESPLPDPEGTRYRDHQIMWVQDLSRTVDYLETRDDVDADRLGYYGLSWGARVGPIPLAVEERIRAAVLVGGGLEDTRRFLPEADPLNFLTRVRTPVLMLNGAYDRIFPLETSQEPMFELLGTDPEHKKHYVAPAGHLVARDDLIRETLDWFDRYLERSGGPSVTE